MARVVTGLEGVVKEIARGALGSELDTGWEARALALYSYGMSSPLSPIDLRSDTVTRPTKPMLEAMMRAELGDDVLGLGDEPTVMRLQEKFAALLGKPAACFVPTGTMANQTSIRAHTEPGDEVIGHGDSHIIHYETGSPAALSGVMIRPLAGSTRAV